ncbi:pyridine nucleotide-disulfide oxidoreductase [Rhodovulum bhavnagarense]|uniref:Pyridine nucleotide-disulfide oxidoreductase n=1 Tax=Rhodovulum bhavnagarense TaxID=992286 RepID=A0A4V2SWC5_9RHOB|nr:FAD-dependent oxidoreductase [Rhodovulum bhavnagarense]TCP61716.1 pyridine nucleotide-disulfide oxidoreductase [Rhodovulum bhavnagarense]
MTSLTRRRFVNTCLAGAVVTGACGWAVARFGARDRIVVVGGGPAGATAALALRQANPEAGLLLIERDPRRLRPSEVAAFDRPLAGPGLDALRAAGIEVVLDDVAGLDWGAARLDLFSGRRLEFDRAVLAPGTAAIQEPVAGFDAVARHRWPAAWGSAREARRLRAQLAALPQAGHVVLRLPATLSHPEAALERAVRLAAFLHRSRPGGRLTILDGSNDADLATRFGTRLAMQGMRTDADWRGGGTVLRVDARQGLLETNEGLLRADVVNFVTRQGAGRIAHDAGLVDASGWCPTDARGRSCLRPGVTVVGDARKTAQRTVAGAFLSARSAAAGLAPA